MAISPSDFNLSISHNPIRIVIGMTSNLGLSFSNTSLVYRGYNLTVELTIPDGVSYVNSAISPTSIINNIDGSITINWISIKDLSPNEIDYILNVTLKADENFRNTGLPVPFDIPLIAVNLEGTVDTLPRGNDDPGNIKITKTDSSSFIPLRYFLSKSSSKTEFELGEILTYALSVTIPKGLKTYNVVVSDILPMNQIFIGNALINNNPIHITQVGQNITFPTQLVINENLEDSIIEFKFDDRIIEWNNSDPFIETQTNNATLNYSINQQGTPANPLVDLEPVNITNSSIKLDNLQRNVSQGQSFTSDNINIFKGQTLEYNLKVTNNGPNTVYNLVISNLISSFLSFLSNVYVEVGTLTHSGEATGGLVTWLFDQLLSGQSVNATFSMKVSSQPIAPINNFSYGNFAVLLESPYTFESNNSNNMTSNPYTPTIQINTCSTATIFSNYCTKNK